MSVILTRPVFAALTKAPPEYVDLYWPYAQQLLGVYGILANKNRLAAFIATIRVESNNLQDIEEGLYYKSELRLATIFRRVFDVNKNKQIDGPDIEAARPYVRNPKELSKILYGGFHGRGLIQITWRANYESYGRSVGQDFLTNPDRMLEPEHALKSACWFFKDKKCYIPADLGSMDGVTKIVNPAMMHAAERRAAFYESLKELSLV
jgi:putative chitinase